MIVGSSTYERFRLDSLASFQRSLRTEAEFLDPQLAELLRASSTFRLRDETPSADPTLPLCVHFEVSACAGVARNLLDLDLELRRAATYIASGKSRPAGGISSVEIIAATRSHSLDVQMSLGRPIYALLTSAPITYLQTLDWFWLHRQTRVRVQSPNEAIDPTYAWSAMIRTADDLVRQASAAVVEVDVAADGTSVFGFVAARPVTLLG